MPMRDGDRARRRPPGAPGTHAVARGRADHHAQPAEPDDADPAGALRPRHRGGRADRHRGGVAVRADVWPAEATRRGSPRRDGAPQSEVRRGRRARRVGQASKAQPKDARHYVGAREVGSRRVHPQAQRARGAVNDVRRTARPLSALAKADGFRVRYRRHGGTGALPPLQPPDAQILRQLRTTRVRRAHRGRRLRRMPRGPKRAGSWRPRRVTVSEDPLRILFLDSQGAQRVCQGLLTNHVPGLVVEKLCHLEGRLPRILNGKLRPVERSVLLVQLGRGIVLFLRVVEASEVDAEGGEGIPELRVLAVQVDRLLVQPQNFLRFDFRHSESRLGFPEERDRVGRIGLRRLVEVLVRGIVIELAEGLFARADVVLGGGGHTKTAPQILVTQIKIPTRFSFGMRRAQRTARWSRNQSRSLRYSWRISEIPSTAMISRSRPRPHASTGAFRPSGSVTSGRKMPLPPSSIHVPSGSWTSGSMLGSVYGKYPGRNFARVKPSRR